MSKPIVLASSSPFRKALLQRLQLPFTTATPNIDESALPNELAPELVQRLAKSKAEVLASRFSHHLIIGSDQVAVAEGNILGKPHTEENAYKQLMQFSGKKVTFYTGLSVYDSAAEEHHTCLANYSVVFRCLSAQEIWAYIRAEQQLQCAGRSEERRVGKECRSRWSA